MGIMYSWMSSFKLPCMSASSTSKAAGASTGSDLQTLIFLDVDGVLNVGIKDGSLHPLSFSEDNLQRARKLSKSSTPLSAKDRATINRLLSASERSLQSLGESPEWTYVDLCSGPGLDVSHVLVRRLARLLEAAGPNSSVVLSSTWRQPKHAEKVSKLEKAIGEQLGRPFTFTARTPLQEELTAAGRLACLGVHLRSHSAEASAKRGRLRVLVLEDFHITKMGTWDCKGSHIGSTRDVEEYLCKCIPANLNPVVRLLHTYDNWTSPDGTLVELGCGITRRHLDEGLQFLGADVSGAAVEQSGLPRLAESQPKPVQLPTVGASCNSASDNKSGGGSSSSPKPAVNMPVLATPEEDQDLNEDILELDGGGIDPFKRLVTLP